MPTAHVQHHRPNLPLPGVGRLDQLQIQERGAQQPRAFDHRPHVSVGEGPHRRPTAIGEGTRFRDHFSPEERRDEVSGLIEIGHGEAKILDPGKDGSDLRHVRSAKGLMSCAKRTPQNPSCVGLSV